MPRLREVALCLHVQRADVLSYSVIGLAHDKYCEPHHTPDKPFGSANHACDRRLNDKLCGREPSSNMRELSLTRTRAGNTEWSG
jgi:hypothetical protein